MKFSCSRPELYEIVSNVSRAVSGKTSLAVLEGILIRAKGDTLSFLGYDLDLGISAQMGAQVEEEGRDCSFRQAFCRHDAQDERRYGYGPHR